MKTSVTLKVRAKCPTHARSDMAVRDLTLAVDEPTGRGGTNLEPTLTETALAALGHKCASQLGVDIRHLRMEPAADFDRRGVTVEEEIEVPFSAVTVTVKASGSAPLEDLGRVAKEAENYCPLSNLFREAGTRLKVVWQAA